MGVQKSGEYLVDPDGAGIGDAPIKAQCDMDGDIGNLFIFTELKNFA